MQWNRRVLLAAALLVQPLAHAQQLPADCPDSPNCVNSYQVDDQHEPMPPLSFEGSPEAAMERLVALVDAMPRTEVVESDALSAHVEFTIALFGFVDDVAFVCDTTARVIHFRSASRVGYYDLGVNRSRMEEISEVWYSDNKNAAE